MQSPETTAEPTAETALAPTGPPPTAGASLAPYLHARSAEFLRALDGEGPTTDESALALRRSARRIGGALRVFRPLLDPVWADDLRTELSWFSGTLAREHACTARLARLMDSLHRLSDPAPLPGQRGDGAATPKLAVGTARAGALLERQLTLARTRAHSAALQALGSSRFHAVADAVALLASDVPLATPGSTHLAGQATHARDQLETAVGALAPSTAEPYDETQDAPWHQVRRLLRLHRYAQEVTGGPQVPGDSVVALDIHRDAAEAATAAAAAARTPRIAPATAYALGVLHADQRHEVAAARRAFRRSWQLP
ncbi:CHAD domain-containing protein [Streptomyces sp. NPDC050504]|uniref:CHAD domain-containing protein n=1 Tax=Streptomyces sp. NPDC050504 TaxID=3365618 RepID=UPI0037B3A59A